MDFYNFYEIGRGVVHAHDIPRSKTLAQIQRAAGKNVPWPILQILVLKHCYLEFFPLSLDAPLHCINDTLLDFDPVSDYTFKDLIVVKSRESSFCFRLEEILSIFHNDLSKSVLEYEPQHQIVTLTKSFRLPTHPYLQERFTMEDISQIVQQMVVKFDALPRKFPEVYLFLRNAKMILETCRNKSNYHITTYLETYFESQHTHYVEKYSVKTRENQSHWDASIPKRIRTEPQMYYWFLENVFAVTESV